MTTAPCGAWPSPISAADVARGKRKLGFPSLVDGQVWWEEGRPDDGGRITVMRSDANGEPVEVLPAPWNARNRVHEYGGRSYLAVPPTAAGHPWRLVFANFADQRLHLCHDAAPRPLTPVPAEPTALRYADLALSPDATEVWCVREQHRAGQVHRAIVAVPLDGSAADSVDAVRILVSGADFFACPTPAPDGRHLAWICWDHPRMPWDGTELHVAPVGDLVEHPSDPTTVIMGGPAESVLAPAWRDADTLYAVSDASGWWNIHQVDRTGSAPRQLHPIEQEFAGPPWQLGARPFAVLADGRIAVTHGQGGHRLGILDPDTGVLADPDLPCPVFQPCLDGSGTTITGIAGGPVTPWSVVRIEVDGDLRVLRQEVDVLPDPGYLPVPRSARLPGGPDGAGVHAIVYPPNSPVAVPPQDELPPYVVWAHGGPTASSVPVLDLEKAYFTSRGIGVVDVNYGGSSGYGRIYRERLRGQWGVVDVEDAVTAATALADAGQADRARLGVRGASAGAWTALVAVTSALTRTGGTSGTDAVDPPDAEPRPVFAAAVSYFGVTDRLLSAATTHDFESRYLEGLIGALPGAEARYRARSPRGHVTSRTCPVLLLQGLDDPVVVPAHAEIIASELAAAQIPHAHLTFPGEAHGFRRAATIVAALEAELSLYGRFMGFAAPGVPPVAVTPS